MALRKISPTHVESDSGFSLQPGPMQHYWIYTEGKRKIHVNSEAVHLGREGWGLCVYLSRSLTVPAMVWLVGLE